MGVAFGDELQETIQMAKDRVADGKIAPDMTCGDLDFEKIVNFYYERFSVFMTDDKVYGWIGDELENIKKCNADLLFKNWADWGKTCSIWGLQGIVVDLINHFETGNGSDYSSDKLSAYAKNHANTKIYLNNVWKEFKKALPVEGYDLYKTKKNTDFSDYINWHATRPKFNLPLDYVKGLAMIAHDTQGLKIDVKDYAYCPLKKVYTGVFHVDIYDHFGLDPADVEDKFGQVTGFRAWYALQHYEGFQQQFQPFVTHFVNDYRFASDYIQIT